MAEQDFFQYISVQVISLYIDPEELPIMRGVLSALFTLLYPWTCLTMAVVFYGTDMIGPDPEDRDYDWIKVGLKRIPSSKLLLPVQDAGWRVFYQWLPNVIRITRGWLGTVRESGLRPRSKAR